MKNVSPSSLSLGGIPEGYSAPWVASETNKVKGEELMSGRDNIRSTPSTSLPHLCGKTKRVKDSACVSKGQTKSDQEGKGFGVKSVYTPI